MKIALIFGGAGYIGGQLARRLSEQNRYDKIILADIRQPASPLPDKVEFQFCDVRQPIQPQLACQRVDWIFNFAAVHREPGHLANEYFDTNLSGARHVCTFAEAIGCENIFFTSSISVYGTTTGATTEDTPKYPYSPYGISKLCAELIHEAWWNADRKRRLLICRPGVVYGPGDPGNILRMIRAIQRGYFFFPGSPHIKKSYAYIYGLLDSLEYVIASSQSLLHYNYVECETESIGGLAQIIRQTLNCKAPLIPIPLALLQPAAQLMQVLSGGKSPIHPSRVKKAAMPTHIVPLRLTEMNFPFQYNFESSLKDWLKKAPQDFRKSGL